MQAICTYCSHFCHLHPQSLFLSTYLLRYSFLTFSVSSSSASLFDVNIHSFLLSSLLACKQLQYFFFQPNYGSGNQSVLWIIHLFLHLSTTLKFPRSLPSLSRFGQSSNLSTSNCISFLVHTLILSSTTGSHLSLTERLHHLFFFFLSEGMPAR